VTEVAANEPNGPPSESASSLKQKTDVADQASTVANSRPSSDLLPVTEIEATLQGLKISSPVLGVIILALSFFFFYLYLKYVYPIHEIF
jgi:hypothetical protein